MKFDRPCHGGPCTDKGIATPGFCKCAADAAEIERLRAALEPFSDMAGELFARNWNRDQVVVALDNPGDPHRLTANDFFAVRLALTLGADQQARTTETKE